MSISMEHEGWSEEEKNSIGDKISDGNTFCIIPFS